MWDDDRDSTFFRITGDLFSHEFLAGASALLASYDDEVMPASTPATGLVAFRVVPASREVTRHATAR